MTNDNFHPEENWRLARDYLEAALPWYIREKRRRAILLAADVFARAYARAREASVTSPAKGQG